MTDPQAEIERAQAAARDWEATATRWRAKWHELKAENERVRRAITEVSDRNRLMRSDCRDPNSYGSGACDGAMEAAAEIEAALAGGEL